MYDLACLCTCDYIHDCGSLLSSVRVDFAYDHMAVSNQCCVPSITKHKYRSVVTTNQHKLVLCISEYVNLDDT